MARIRAMERAKAQAEELEREHKNEERDQRVGEKNEKFKMITMKTVSQFNWF